MTEVDVGSLSYAEMVALRAKLDSEIQDKRGEELKVLADGFARKVQAAGFSVAEAVEALQPYVDPASPGKRAAQNATLKVLYRDPADPANTWSGRGRAARWLADYEAQGRKRDEFRVAST
ncbi:H-NS family nucleoid-associated regulatory protein [Roseateles sp.]|uniref:H-NS histone family protein n=1 Tax=Roseateles sp. TaxID=1971397 RepID=UPI003D0BFBDC